MENSSWGACFVAGLAGSGCSFWVGEDDIFFGGVFGLEVWGEVGAGESTIGSLEATDLLHAWCLSLV